MLTLRVVKLCNPVKWLEVNMVMRNIGANHAESHVLLAGNGAKMVGNLLDTRHELPILCAVQVPYELSWGLMDDERMTLARGKYIEKSKRMLVFIDFMAGYLPIDNPRKKRVLHHFSIHLVSVIIDK